MPHCSVIAESCLIKPKQIRAIIVIHKTIVGTFLAIAEAAICVCVPFLVLASDS